MYGKEHHTGVLKAQKENFIHTTLEHQKEVSGSLFRPSGHSTSGDGAMETL
jgi:hypothetical protein